MWLTSCLVTNKIIYRRRGKIHWAKHSRFQPYEVFHRNTFAASALATSVYYLPIANNSQENFHGTLKNYENLAQQIFPCLRYSYSDS